MSRRIVVIAAAVTVAVLAVAAVVFVPRFRQAGERGESAPAPAHETNGMAMPETDRAMEAPSRAELVIDARRQQLIGVRTAPVRMASIAEPVRLVGIVRYDETRQTEVNTKIDGWIRDLRADYTGKPVRQGETLFSLYSPELVATQNEYLLALRGHAQSATAEVPAVREYSTRLVEAARERLRRWDLTDDDIREIEQRGRPAEVISVRSPATGLVVEKTAIEGMRVMAGQTLFRIADLSVVWVEADVPEPYVAAIRIGQTATVTLASFPGESLAGRATYVYPTVDPQTRTAKVRFQFANRRNLLKPGMFATIEIADRATQALVVPIDALLDTGREQLVFVAHGEGRFEPRRVTVGQRARESVEITGGLREGEQVASGATFFLDSESQLRAGVQAYEAPPGTAMPGAAPSQIDISFRAQPDPPRTGDNTLEVMVKDAAGQPIADAEVTVTFFMAAMPTMNMPAMRNQATLPPAGGGVYRGQGQVMMAGRWDVTVDVSRGGQRLGSKQFGMVAR